MDYNFVVYIIKHKPPKDEICISALLFTVSQVATKLSNILQYFFVKV